MKRYTFAQLAKRNCAECTTTITTTLPERYYLVADVDRLREESRGWVIAAIDMAGGVGLHDCYTNRCVLADRILAAIFGEVGNETEAKQEAAEATLFRLRECLQTMVDLVDSAHEDGVIIHVPDRVRDELPPSTKE